MQIDIYLVSMAILIGPVISLAWFAIDASAWTVHDILVGVWRERNVRHFVAGMRIPDIRWRAWIALLLGTYHFFIAIPMVAYLLTHTFFGFAMLSCLLYAISGIWCAFLPAYFEACTLFRVRREAMAAKEVLEQIRSSDRSGSVSIRGKSTSYTARFSRQAIPTTFMLKRSQMKYDWREQFGPIGAIVENRVLVGLSLRTEFAVELCRSDCQPTSMEFTETNSSADETVTWSYVLNRCWRIAPGVYVSQYKIQCTPA
ncbi:hypothetical protein DTL42_01965 [Bremerella cremea]|uniref:Uncharacterized protein n=1 Tax=Bremerella cremea TaxID=1031537 RepID=A0A368KU55_9BACT|nr:hypothetical protein DTL42_01965 [Bremerella cremea]